MVLNNSTLLNTNPPNYHNGIDSVSIELLIPFVSQQQMRKGEQLFRQADPADKMFFITQGRVKLSRLLKNGNEITIDFRKPGDILGENNFLDQRAYSTSAICIEDSLIGTFSRTQFEKIILSQPALGLKIIKKLINKLSLYSSRVSSLTIVGTEDRVFEVLCTIAKEHGSLSPKGIMIQFPITHRQLSDLTGKHRVSVTRALKTLKAEGRVSVERNRFVLSVEDCENNFE